MSARFIVVATCVAIAGCSAPVSDHAAVVQQAGSLHDSTETFTASAREAARPRIVVLGDSLTAGLGVAPEQAYPARLQARLDREQLAYEVINAGVSGDTSAGGLRRLDWSLDGDVRVLIVALGGNDGLRGLPPAQLRANLTAIIDGARARAIAVLLCGMEAPPNFGPDYTAEFRQVFLDLAKTPGVTFLPFLLDGVAGDPRLNQADGIHPNPQGAQKVADLVWPALRPLLSSATS